MSEHEVSTSATAEPCVTTSLADVMTLRVDEEGRRIYLTEEISHDLLADATRALNYLFEQADYQPIELWISSHGGDGDAMLGFLDMIEQVDVPVMGVGFGVVASSAALILAACDHRKVYPRTQVLIHGPRLGGEGSEDLQGTYATVARHEWLFDQMVQVLAIHTKLEDPRTMMTHGEHWFFGQQIVDAGIADVLGQP